MVQKYLQPPAMTRKSSKSNSISAAGVEEIEIHSTGDAVLHHYYVDPIAEKKLVRKLDLRLIPWLSLLYLISFLDRTNIGNAKILGPPLTLRLPYNVLIIAGLEKELNMSADQFYMTLTIFFITYSLFGQTSLVSGYSNRQRSRPTSSSKGSSPISGSLPPWSYGAVCCYGWAS
jgi:hypothetical protein